MFITAKVDLPVLQVIEQGEGDRRKSVALPGGVFPVGCHEVECIANPVNSKGPRWLVIKGTTIGHAEVIWKRWQDPARGDRAVVITAERPSPGAPAAGAGGSTPPASGERHPSGPSDARQ